MRRRLFWFVVGVGLTAFVVVKGREYYEKFTPKGITQQVEKTARTAQGWVSDFVGTFSNAMDERETELREAFSLDGNTVPVQENPRT